MQNYERVISTPFVYRTCEGNALVESALSTLGPMPREADALVVHDDLPPLRCDPSQMVYALASLIENAIKFRGERRPEIRISATASTPTPAKRMAQAR